MGSSVHWSLRKVRMWGQLLTLPFSLSLDKTTHRWPTIQSRTPRVPVSLLLRFGRWLLLRISIHRLDGQCNAMAVWMISAILVPRFINYKQKLGFFSRNLHNLKIKFWKLDQTIKQLQNNHLLTAIFYFILTVFYVDFLYRPIVETWSQFLLWIWQMYSDPDGQYWNLI